MPWTRVSCNNGDPDAGFPPPPGATTALVVPPAVTAGGLGFAATDWMVLTALDRADGRDDLPLLMLRSYSAAGGRFLGFGPGDFSDPAGWPTVNRGRIIRGFYQAGDHVSHPASFTAPVEADFLLPVGVQYYQRGRGLNVMTLGDSLTAGYQTVAHGNGFGFQACTALSTTRRPVTHIASGHSGQSALEYLTRGRTEFAVFRPDVVVIETTSPNGQPATPAEFDRMFAHALAFADHAERHGAVPILKTAVPFSLPEPIDVLRRGINARVRAMAAAGSMLVLDADAAVSDGASPAASLPHFRPPGDAHLNDAGHAAIAAALVPILGRVMATGYDTSRANCPYSG